MRTRRSFLAGVAGRANTELAFDEESSTIRQMALMVRTRGWARRFQKPDDPVVTVLDDPLTHSDASSAQSHARRVTQRGDGRCRFNPKRRGRCRFSFTCHPSGFGWTMRASLICRMLQVIGLREQPRPAGSAGRYRLRFARRSARGSPSGRGSTKSLFPLRVKCPFSSIRSWCGRRTDRAGPASGWAANGRSDRHRNTPVRLMRPARAGCRGPTAALTAHGRSAWRFSTSCRDLWMPAASSANRAAR